MNKHEIPLFCDIFPLEIVEKIVSYLPLLAVVEVMKSENASLASVAQRRYYSNIKLEFLDRPYDVIYKMDDILSMKISEFDALLNSDTVDQLRIEKLLIYVDLLEDDFTFLHEKVFTKASIIVTDVILQFYGDPEWYLEFDWACLPSSPLVLKCIREISVWYPYIGPDVPPLPSNLRKLHLEFDYQHGGNDNGISPRIVFPPNLQEFVSKIPWASMSAYTNLPSTLRTLVLEYVSGFNAEAFNELNLPNLRNLRLYRISGVTEFNELFELPSLLESLELGNLRITNFERRKLPLGLQKLSITQCPLKKFRVDTFPDSLKELILYDTDLPSSEIHIIKFPPGLVSLLVTYSRLTSLNFVNSLPGSLEILNLRKNSLGRLNETDEDADTARSYRIKFPENLQKLNLEYNEHLFTQYSPGNLVFPLSLKDLNLHRTNMGSVDELDLPPGLNSLDLCGNNLVSVDELDLPPGLNSLDLCSNNLELFSKELPDSIQYLGLRSNQLKELINFHLPVNCTRLDLSSNPLLRVQFSNADHPGLKLQHFDLSKVAIAAIRNISPLPQCLAFLDIGSTEVSSLSGIQFPVGLSRLDATNNKIVSLENVEFPPHLEALCLLKNQISSLANICFPDSLLELRLSDNKITSIDAIQLPPKLKKLYFERNAISTINELQLPESLKILTMEDQKWNILLNCVSADGDSSESLNTSRKEGLSSLAGLSNLPSKLWYLNLDNNSLSEQSFQHLEIPASLTMLSVSNNAFDDYYKWLWKIKLAHLGMLASW
ncbi:hypothetical protein BABINDRAFT_163297 [Babjeviella inositovora NRRL Y-12698]|uniref:Uncharacterized protein n=1 Tax=Babjeviella inositovora NRRL Y-12698 TaxID=984486 RepID=A0A1E3QKF4_9ASCO|nr:uncharacterized protein BABINDRAFT_163297 [Babjeviella inositovora NRRL Y-12698]ODQ77934.1 hypothetical protein BABINDRAFT_163297 [Babjeviella inositovora NRRL Y-12698]